MPAFFCGEVKCPFSFLGCSFLRSQSSLLSWLHGFDGSFLLHIQVVEESVVFEQDGCSMVACRVLIRFVGVVASCNGNGFDISFLCIALFFSVVTVCFVPERAVCIWFLNFLPRVFFVSFFIEGEGIIVRTNRV